MNNNIVKILDGRTKFQAGRNYQISKKNEASAMQGLVSLLSITYGVMNVRADKIDENEEWLDDKLHIKPDYFLYIKFPNGELKKWSIEVKTTYYQSFLNDEIIIKAPQVWTCKNKPKDFPNPYVLAATDSKFALIPMGSFWNSEPREIDFGRGIKKKGFLLSVGDYEWHSFLVPLRFANKTDKNVIDR